MKTEIAIIGAGPAGLVAALHAARAGAQVLLLERFPYLGGQLIKQTHKFFGSKAEYAGERGVDIARKLIEEVNATPGVTVWQDATALGYYPDGVLTVKYQGEFHTVRPKKLIVATGAAEKTLVFPNNDLPGIYGAGAVQTLMNVYGVLPGKRLLMIGAGNIGVIVAYQLLQAGVEVAAIVEAGPAAGCYQVHADKVKRCGVPVYTSHTVKHARGANSLDGAVIWQLDGNWQPIPGSEKEFAVDGMCLAVGLSPLTELLWQAGCGMVYVPELGGNIPFRDETLLTTRPNIYIAGDVAGIEEASTAMVEGKIAGLAAALALGTNTSGLRLELAAAQAQLAALRAGPLSTKIRSGLAKVTRANLAEVI
ncbi:MAG: FAD-dependent oxidoreductase [Negativicutes bacterium]|nr:FAD-dependent oxidoreductase [Negativicutes bacterium]